MTLIHTALLCEAQTFIEIYKAKKINSTPKIYQKDNIIICIGGVGKENTLNSLKYVFNNYTVQKAINIGIAGIADTNIPIGTLFCTTHTLDKIKKLPLISVNTPQRQENNHQKDHLYDMEGNHFLNYCTKYINKDNIYIFKIISDHLTYIKLNKEITKQLILAKKNILQNYI